MIQVKNVWSPNQWAYKCVLWQRGSDKECHSPRVDIKEEAQCNCLSSNERGGGCRDNSRNKIRWQDQPGGHPDQAVTPNDERIAMWQVHVLSVRQSGKPRSTEWHLLCHRLPPGHARDMWHVIQVYVLWSDHKFDRDPHICSRGLSKSCGAIVGYIRGLYATVSY